MTTTEFEIPFPESSDRHLKISVGACHLIIHPGEDAPWVKGSYIDPAGILPIKVNTVGGETRLTQELSPIELSGGFQGLTTLDLALGKGRPYWLTIESGASEVQIDLGGLPISRLYVREGASRYALTFSAPNPQPLVLFSLSVGAGVVEVRNLANANLVEMVMEGGAATYRLDFGEQLQREALVRIATGMALVEIALPEAIAAKIATDKTIGNVQAAESLVNLEGSYWTPAAINGKTPLLDMRVNLSIGTLRLFLGPEQNVLSEPPPVHGADSSPDGPPAVESLVDRVEI
ncbi:MAG: hypothetical protein WCF84_21745 [Anaerolineae bacterium]